MKLALLAIALLAATAAQADSFTDPGCFTPLAGFSFITSLPICPPVTQPVTPPVTEPVSMPIVTPAQISDDQGEDNDDQGEIDTTQTQHFIFENGRLVFAAAPAAPVGVPEPSSAWLLVLGLGAVVLTGRKVVYSR